MLSLLSRSGAAMVTQRGPRALAALCARRSTHSTALGTSIDIKEVNISFSAPDVTLVLAHATGFCKGVFNPLVSALTADNSNAASVKSTAGAAGNARVISFDFSGHGASASRQADPTHWDAMCTKDIVEVLTTKGLPVGRASTRPASTISTSTLAGRSSGAAGRSQRKPLIGIGHSMGAAGLLLTEMAHPGTFDGIIAFEPIVFPTEEMARRRDHDYGLAQGALRRKADWSDMALADKYFKSKPLYRNWHPDALQGYYDCGLVRDAAGVRLSCKPQFEAGMYRGFHDGWDRLHLVGCPVAVVAGADHPPDSALFSGDSESMFRGIAERLPVHSFEMMEGTGHFMVMEQPARCAAVVQRQTEWILGMSRDAGQVQQKDEKFKVDRDDGGISPGAMMVEMMIIDTFTDDHSDSSSSSSSSSSSFDSGSFSSDD